MRIVSLALLIMAMTTPASAEEFFTGQALREIQVVEITDEYALLQSDDGTEVEIFEGDVIGMEGGVVVEIGEASITVQSNNTRTKMPVIHGFGVQ